MHEERQKAIKLIMDLQGLTLEQASKVVDKQSRIDQIRNEAENILGEKLPAAISSKFIEEFYEDAPKIGVWIQQSLLCDEGSPKDWRFMNDLDFRVHEDPSSAWFSVDVSQYDDHNPRTILHVMGSPGQVLAKFVQQLSELSGCSDPSRIKFLDQEKVIDPCTIALAASVSTLQCRVETADGDAHEAAIGYESQSLGEVLKQESIVPNRVPDPGFVKAQCMAFDLPFSKDEFEQACEAVNSKKHEQYLLLALEAGETLLQTLGEGQSTSPVVSPRQVYDALLGESRENLEGSKRQVAMAFLANSAAHNNVDTSAAKYDANQFINEALVDLEELIERVERRLPNWQQWQSENRKTDEDSLVYYRYVKGAIADNREFLVRLNSN